MAMHPCRDSEEGETPTPAVALSHGLADPVRLAIIEAAVEAGVEYR